MNAIPHDPTSAATQLADALKFLGHDAREGHSSTLALLELQRIKPDPMTMTQLIDRVEQNARRSLAAIDDFMDLSRARTQPLRIEELDLVDLLVEVVADVWAMASQLGVRVQASHDAESLPGRSDRELLAGALGKLLRDLVTAAPRGADIACSVREEAQAWVFELIAPAPLPEAGAEPVKDAQRRRRTSAGMGLAQVVAERLGGELEAQAIPGEGRVLQLRLPRDFVPKPTTT